MPLIILGVKHVQKKELKVSSERGVGVVLIIQHGQNERSGKPPVRQQRLPDGTRLGNKNANNKKQNEQLGCELG